MKVTTKKYRVNGYEFLCKVRFEKDYEIAEYLNKENEDFFREMAEDRDEEIGLLKYGIYSGEMNVIDDGYFESDVYSIYDQEEAILDCLAQATGIKNLNKKDFEKIGAWYVVKEDDGLYFELEYTYSPLVDVLSVRNLLEDRIEKLNRTIKYFPKKEFEYPGWIVDEIINTIADDVEGMLEVELEKDLNEIYITCEDIDEVIRVAYEEKDGKVEVEYVVED